MKNSTIIFFMFVYTTFMLPIYSSDDSIIRNGKEEQKNHINFYGNSKEVPAYRLKNPVKMDGKLLEKVWQKKGVTGFTQQDPAEGERPSEVTIVWVAYDDQAIYIGARLYENDPDSIISRLGRRDNIFATDWFAIAIDAYRDKQTGFFFSTTPSGSIDDGTISNDSQFDHNWDGIWECKTNIDSQGWTVEMRIPYSQLRFTKKEEYVWGFGAGRFLERKQEISFIPPIPKEGNKQVSLYPPLVGIKNISPPRRIEINPYIVSSGHFLNYDDEDPFDRKRSAKFNTGADIKIGLGSNFTLDGTINPDFGQVELDPAVVNLSAYETFFTEKRPFFIEGANIFSFGNRGATNRWSFQYAQPNFFYSRRIGRQPQGETMHSGDEENIPINTKIIGAGKISGKTKQNIEIGILQAITAREFAEIDSQGVRFKDEVEPLTSYTVLRGFKNFNDNKFGLGFIGTSVIRDLRTENLESTLRKNAFTGAADGYAFLGSKKTWVLNGWFGFSQLSGSREAITELQEASQHYYQRPDFKYESLDINRTSLNGWAGRLALNKEKGSFYLNTAIGVNSPGFETNDLGFHWRGNLIEQHLVLGYRWFKPGKIFRNANLFLANNNDYDFDGNKIGNGIMTFFNGQFLNYFGISSALGYFPKSYDITRTRGGPIMENPSGYFSELYVNSDNRKQVVAELSGHYGANSPGGWEYSVETEITWKPSSRMDLEFEPRFFRDHAIAQWIDNFEDEYAAHTFNHRYLFAILDQKQLSASFRFNYTFTPKLSFQAYFQPLIAVGKYSDYKELAKAKTFNFIHYGENGTSITPDGDWYEIDPDGTGQHNYRVENPDFNYKSLRGTALIRWEYSPGSTMFLVWTHDRSDEEEIGDFRFNRDIKILTKLKSDNIILLKLSYWWNP